MQNQIFRNVAFSIVIKVIARQGTYLYK